MLEAYTELALCWAIYTWAKPISLFK